MGRFGYFLLPLLLLLIPGCTKNEDSIDSEKEIKREKIEVIQKYLDGIGNFDSIPQTGLVVEEISRSRGTVMYLGLPYTYQSGYYYPYTVTKHIQGADSKNNLIPIDNESGVWPGNLLQGKGVPDGKIMEVNLNDYRMPGRIYLDVVSGQGDMIYYREVEEFSAESVNFLIEDILDDHTHGYPADVQFIQKDVHSMEEMAYYLDLDPENFDLKTNGAFSDVNWKDNTKSFKMIKLEQIYFNMVYEYEGLEDLFNENIDKSALEPYTEKGNPLCYISSVTYGRYFIILYEVDYRDMVMDGILTTAFNGEETSARDNTAYRNAKKRIVKIGGNEQDDEDMLEAVSNAPNLREFIMNGAAFTKETTGVPLYYTVSYVNNNNKAKFYKEIDEDFTDREMLAAKNTNDVEITLKSITSLKLVKSGGNRHIHNESYFTVGPVRVSVSNGSSWIQKASVTTGITQVKTKDYNTTKNYSYVLRTGELGENTDKRIKLEFDVTYHNVRSSTNLFGIGKTTYDRQTRTYKKMVIFSFNRNTQRWQVVTNDAEPGWGTNSAFRNVVIKDNFNFCDVNFTLNYSFKANYTSY